VQFKAKFWTSADISTPTRNVDARYCTIRNQTLRLLHLDQGMKRLRQAIENGLVDWDEKRQL
jgi:hypothetical protein